MGIWPIQPCNSSYYYSSIQQWYKITISQYIITYHTSHLIACIACRSSPLAIEPHDPKWPRCHHDGLVQGLINILTSLVRKPILATTHVWQSVWPISMAYLLNLGNQPGHLMLDSSFLSYNPVGSSQHQLSPSPYIRRLIISTLGNKHHVRVWFGFHIIISQNNITCQYNKYYLHIYIALWLWQSSISYHIISIYIYTIIKYHK